MKYAFFAVLALTVGCVIYFTIAKLGSGPEKEQKGSEEGYYITNKNGEVIFVPKGTRPPDTIKVEPPKTMVGTGPGPTTIVGTQATKPDGPATSTGPSREAIALQRQFEINRLLEEAKAKSTIKNGLTGLRSIEQLLKLDPQNKEALALRDKINALYFTDSTTGIRMKEIPAGTFTMGISPSEKEVNEHNSVQHQVTITKSFLMSVTEVTQKQWKTVMPITKSRFEGDDLPVIDITWLEATAFCEKLSSLTGKKFRLPTEAEWEYACRAETLTMYNTGDDEKALERAGKYTKKIDDPKGARTVPVASFTPNNWGLYDMHGNAREWCADKYKSLLSNAAVIDPLILKDADNRVARGGAAESFPINCRSSGTRVFYKETQSDTMCGLRLVCEMGSGTDTPKTQPAK